MKNPRHAKAAQFDRGKYIEFIVRIPKKQEWHYPAQEAPDLMKEPE